MKRIILLALFFIFQANLLLAGPGGKIARDLFDSPLGKVAAVVLFLIFFPFIAYSWFKRKKSTTTTKTKLTALSRINHDLFDEINLRNRVTDIFTRVHKGWSEQNVEDCDDYMTSWYSQNQQIVFLNEWKSKGMINICSVQEIKSIEPIHIRLTNNPNFENSRIMYAIDANMEDYLVKENDSSVIEGKPGFKDVETVWTLKLNDGIWKVDNIEQSHMISSYMKMDTQPSDAIIEKLSGTQLS